MLAHERVLFLNPAGWQKESLNLGLCYLAAALKRAGAEVRIIDTNRYVTSDARLIQQAREFRPTVIGLSVKTATAKEAGRLASALKSEFPKVMFLAGGPHLTIAAEAYMKACPAFDYALMGEAEESIVELLEGLSSSRPVAAIPGVVHRRGREIVVNSWSPPANLDLLAVPDLDAIEDFTWKGFRYPIVSSRGCPFDCTYCCVNKLTGSRRWRSRSVTSVIDELERVAKTRGIRKFEIWDDNFTLHLPRAKEICRALIARELNLSWYCHNGIRADRIDAELARLMKQAGCTSIAFGIESGNPETFNSIKKGESLAAVVNAVKLVKEAGIDAVGYFIIGLPGDNLQRFVETVRFQRSLGLSHHVFGMLIPYPKTEVWEIVQNHGKMLRDITETQHFNDDIVPISFEMPEFPRQDMVRAFYISKFFPLFEAVDRTARAGRRPVVIYQGQADLNPFLAGMFLTCPPETEHIVVSEADPAAIRALPAFSQVPPTIRVSFQRSIPAGLPADSVTFVCDIDHLLSMRLLLSNSSLLVFEPTEAVLVEARAPRSYLSSLPGVGAGAAATLAALPRIVGASGRRGMLRAAITPARAHAPRLVGFLKDAWSIKRRSRKVARNTILTVWHIGQYAWARRMLRSMKPAKNTDYPYANHSTYL
jgi:anaerobic magnesium-protoporphyrin IX monomethyl ester cyclase